jgi:hypothetical protein
MNRHGNRGCQDDPTDGQHDEEQGGERLGGTHLTIHLKIVVVGDASVGNLHDWQVQWKGEQRSRSKVLG